MSDFESGFVDCVYESDEGTTSPEEPSTEAKEAIEEPEEPSVSLAKVDAEAKEVNSEPEEPISDAKEAGLGREEPSDEPDFIKASLAATDSDLIPSTLGFDEETPNLDLKKKEINTVNLGHTTDAPAVSKNPVVRLLISDVGLGIIFSLALLVLSIIYRVNLASSGEIEINMSSSDALMKLLKVYLGAVLAYLGTILAPIGVIANIVSLKVPTKLMKILNYGLLAFAFLLLFCLVI